MIADWIDDETVEGSYPVECYRDALATMPEDLRVYSTAPDEVRRAMQSASQRAVARHLSSVPAGER